MNLRVIPEPEWLDCACGQRVTWLTPDGLCLDCEGKRSAEALRESVRAARLENIVKLLTKDGMSSREIASTAEKITPEIAAVLPSDLSQGFGLMGLPGIGKTGAMAVLFREHILAGGYGMWLSWPDAVNRWRIQSVRDGGIADVGEEVERAQKAPALVLDDLGAERIKGSYLDDWAASQLDLIVDARYREERPTHYTTSLMRPSFVKLYGPRLFSRLCGENRLIELKPLHDRRV